MFKFFKDYFNFSHQEDGYVLSRVGGEFTKVSKKKRLIVLIYSYIIIIFSFLVFLAPLDFGANLFLWIGIITLPMWAIFVFDYRLFKIMRLYYYSKSTNINKRIIYEGYRFNNYHNVFYKAFHDVGKKRIWNDYTSYSFRIDCFFGKNKFFLKVKPYKVIMNINGKREIIRKNSLTLNELFQQLKSKVKEQIQ